MRNLPKGTKDALARVAEIHGRSLEAEARHAIKRHLSLNEGINVTILNEHNQPDQATVIAETRVQTIQAKRDSVQRKLDGGSNAVTIDTLRELEKLLTQARLKLGEVCRTHPLALLHAMQPLSSETD